MWALNASLSAGGGVRRRCEWPSNFSYSAREMVTISGLLVLKFFVFFMYSLYHISPEKYRTQISAPAPAIRTVTATLPERTVWRGVTSANVTSCCAWHLQYYILRKYNNWGDPKPFLCHSCKAGRAGERDQWESCNDNYICYSFIVYMQKQRKTSGKHDGWTERIVFPIYRLCKRVPDKDRLLTVPEQF